MIYYLKDDGVTFFSVKLLAVVAKKAINFFALPPSIVFSKFTCSYLGHVVRLFKTRARCELSVEIRAPSLCRNKREIRKSNTNRREKMDRVRWLTEQSESFLLLRLDFSQCFLYFIFLICCNPPQVKQPAPG